MSRDKGRAEVRKAVLLMSGGLDSTTVLEMAKAQGYEIHALSFSYGQRHSIELESVKRVLQKSPVKSHKIVELDLRVFGGSALTDIGIDVPKTDHFECLSKEVPVTYVPARNTIFLSFALSFAETLGAFDIFIGANAIDYSNYPDCRPEYIQAFEVMANLATAVAIDGKGTFKIHAPLMKMTKAEIIRAGLALGVDYSLTNSCYDPSPEGHACGKCDACHLRLKGFEANQIKDPAVYRARLS
jgi:7-cyano-7-deazaguanine synthase